MSTSNVNKGGREVGTGYLIYFCGFFTIGTCKKKNLYSQKYIQTWLMTWATIDVWMRHTEFQTRVFLFESLLRQLTHWARHCILIPYYSFEKDVKLGSPGYVSKSSTSTSYHPGKIQLKCSNVPSLSRPMNFWARHFILLAQYSFG